MIKPYLHIRSSKLRGRGVFTRKSIPNGTIIEIAPVIDLSVKDAQLALDTKLANYVFRWGKSARRASVALGWASIYNHQAPSNCEYRPNFKRNILTIRTVRPIKKGEQLFVNYNCDWNDKTPVWFEVK
jgi:SET domain-containing protein